jgi:uncharacterized membrane protein
MTAPGNTTLRAGAAGLVALILLQVAWYAWLFPATQLLPTLAITTLLPAYALWVCTGNLRRGVLIGGIVCLLYFCHGVSSAWSEPASRLLALVEIALTLTVIGALGWDARHYRRPP